MLQEHCRLNIFIIRARKNARHYLYSLIRHSFAAVRNHVYYAERLAAVHTEANEVILPCHLSHYLHINIMDY